LLKLGFLSIYLYWRNREKGKERYLLLAPFNCFSPFGSLSFSIYWRS